MTQHYLRPNHVALVALMFSLTGLASAADQTTINATHTKAQHDMTETLLQLALPPLASTQTIIAALPQVQAARAGMAYSVARGERLASGTYEWNLKIGTQQRRETTGMFAVTSCGDASSTCLQGQHVAAHTSTLD